MKKLPIGLLILFFAINCYAQKDKAYALSGEYKPVKVTYFSRTKIKKQAKNKAAYYNWNATRLQQELDRQPLGGYIYVRLNDFNDNDPAEPLWIFVYNKTTKREVWRLKTQSGREKFRPPAYLELTNNHSYYPVDITINFPARVMIVWRKKKYVFDF